LATAPGRLVIQGHASASGSVTTNDRLSTARARSVATMLQAFGARASSTTIRGVGEAAGASPEAAARDRAVTVRIPARDLRPPLPAPVDETGIDWRSTSPTESPAEPRGLSPVGATVEFKHSFQTSTPFGPDWKLVWELEIGFKGELAPDAPVLAVASLRSGKRDAQLKVALTNSVVLTGSFAETKIGVQFRGVPLKPEAEIGLVNLLADPGKLKAKLEKNPADLAKLVSVKFSLPAAKTREYDLGELVPSLRGVVVRGTMQPKVIVSLAPSELLLARLGASFAARAGVPLGTSAGVPIVAGVVGGAAWTVLALYLIDRAHRRGQSWARVVNLRRGYALRVAAEALDWRIGEVPGSGSTRAWSKAQAQVLAARQQSAPGSLDPSQEAVFRRTYADLYEGWEAAGDALATLGTADYAALMSRLQALGGGSLDRLGDLVLRHLGGTTERETPLTLDWLRTDAPAGR